MEITRVVGTRSTCDRGHTGCIIVRNRQILVTGYSGAPKGLAHCDEAGHQIKTVTHEDGHKSEHCMRTAHAEQNAIVQAAKIGVNIDGGTLYCKMTPCATCAKMIINAGIARIVCEKRYHAGAESEQMFQRVSITLEYFDTAVESYGSTSTPTPFTTNPVVFS